jgi:hypothetical protein
MEGNCSKYAVCERIKTGCITEPNRSSQKKGQKRVRCLRFRLTKTHAQGFVDGRRMIRHETGTTFCQRFLLCHCVDTR